MNGDHLSAKTRELLDRPIGERIAHIQKDSWIPYSQANKILQQLEDLLKHLSFSKTRTIGELITYGCGRRHVNPGF